MCPDPTGPGTLVLVPVPIDPQASMASSLASAALARVRGLRHFVAENPRTARRFLAGVLDAPVQAVEFAELNEHTPQGSLEPLLTPLLAGHDVGLVSEAGCPAVADPGATLVALAHARGIPVSPLPGPSAILLAIMASGLDGQAFRFAGYLPADPAGRARRACELERDSARLGEAAWFIETPYRNAALWQTLLEVLQPGTRLSVSAGLGTPETLSRTCPVGAWRSEPAPRLDRRPAVFGLQAARISEPVRRPSRPRRS